MSRPPHDPSGDAGFSIVEVVFAMALFLVIALGAGAALSAAGSRTAESQVRATASGIAEEDLAQMRTRRITDPGGYQSSRTVDVDGVAYDVRSTAEYQLDASGASCTGTSGAPSSLLITSTVTSGIAGGEGGGDGAAIPPVRLSSLVSIPRRSFTTTSGVLVRRFIGRDGSTPVTDIPVAISGPASGTTRTNAQGCAIFVGLATGTYRVTADVDGFVGVDGVQRQTADVGVTAGALSSATALRYAPPGSLRARFVVAARTGTDTIASRSADLRLTGSELPGGAITPALSSESSVATVTSLYPSQNPYGVVAGACASPAGAPTAPTGQVDPGDAVDVTVRQAPLHAEVGSSLAAALGLGSRAGLRVVLRRTDAPAGCTPATVTMETTSDGTIQRSAGVTTGDDGLPFGTYSVCVQTTSGTIRRTSSLQSVVRTSATRPAAVTSISGTALVPGACAT